ncbi:hypothetical protein CVT25_013312 [Psilocybe cyanescens]|uniref:Uncharacterized protein n=1 Tax=Psilocybe cyanescens TaxID=93625 RepID=A0A409XHG6_PSICY|nr:hypothetical protein CVT25_013312 [Psilocybe cyanescens]
MAGAADSVAGAGAGAGGPGSAREAAKTQTPGFPTHAAVYPHGHACAHQRPDNTSIESVVEKKIMINLVQAYSVSVKHLLRGGQGVYYEDLYPLIPFLPRYVSKAVETGFETFKTEVNPEIELAGSDKEKTSSMFSPTRRMDTFDPEALLPQLDKVRRTLGLLPLSSSTDLDHFCLCLQRELHEITAHVNPELNDYIFTHLNQPFAPSDRRHAAELVKELAPYSLKDGDPNTEPGTGSIRRTLVTGWKMVDTLTRSK